MTQFYIPLILVVSIRRHINNELEYFRSTSGISNNSLLQITVRATNLVPGSTYRINSIATGSIGSGANTLSVRDSSNNFGTSLSTWQLAVDPDNNSVSDDPNENTPTPCNIVHHFQ